MIVPKSLQELIETSVPDVASDTDQDDDGATDDDTESDVPASAGKQPRHNADASSSSKLVYKGQDFVPQATANENLTGQKKKKSTHKRNRPRHGTKKSGPFS